MRRTGSPNRAWLETLAADVAQLRARGQEVLLVSSGAIALGPPATGPDVGAAQAGRETGRGRRRPDPPGACLEGRARAARLSVAQILLTFGDTEERRRYLNARNTLSTLLQLGAIPVINENDTVATAEIRYGDNDRLAARVAQMISADCLVLLSDVDGLYSADPDARSDRAVHSGRARITPEIERMAGGAASAVGSGGMATKIAAAKIAVAAGCHMASRSAGRCIRSAASKRARVAAGSIHPPALQRCASSGLPAR